jgi:hypothetical protein
MVSLARRASLALSIALLTLFAASTASAVPVLEQDFEGGLASPDGTWTTTGFWHAQANPQNVVVKAPEINPGMVTIPSGTLPAAFSGNQVGWFGEASTGTFCGPGWSVVQAPKSGCTSTTTYSGYLTSPPFSLSGAISAILRFRSWWEIEGVAANAYDTMQVEYSTNGSTWTAVGKLNPANNPAGDHHEGYSNNGLLAEPGWKDYLVDLSAAIGQPSVQVRFAFDTEDHLYNGFRGWLVDDVVVSTPFDAGAPVLNDVKTCDGLKPASIWVAHGANFVQNSQVVIDGVVSGSATMPAPDRLELQAGNAGLHTLKLISPNGTESNTLQFAAGNCAEQGGGPSGADKRPSKVQVFCNYIVASETDTCTATVADATGGGRIPTGTVKFTSANGGAFMFGDTCTLKKTELSTVSSCTIEGFKPAKGKPIAVSGSYSGDSGLLPSGGATQFLMAAPGNGAYLQTIKPFEGFGAPNGPHKPTVTITIKNPVGGATAAAAASLSANGSICNSGMGGAGASSSLLAGSALADAPTSVVAVVSAKGKAKGKGKRPKRNAAVPGLKYKKPKAVKRIDALVVTKVKRNAKAGKVTLKLKFDKRKLAKKLGKRKRLKLVVRLTLSFKKGQPGVVYRVVTLKRAKGGGFKVVKVKAKGGKGKAKKAAAVSLARPVAGSAQAAAKVYQWTGSNDCNQLTVAAQFDQGEGQPPAVGFQWIGQMVCLDGSAIPFNLAPPVGRGTVSGKSATFSFAEFANPGFTLSGTLSTGSAVASGKIGGQFPDGRSCQALAPTALVQTQ